MSFDWNKFYDLSKQIFHQFKDTELNEAAIRTTISRLYYALFNLSANYIKMQGENIPKDRQHEFVRRYFHNKAPKKLVSIGGTLGRLSKLRRDADYDNENNPTDKLLKMTFKLYQTAYTKLMKEI